MTLFMPRIPIELKQLDKDYIDFKKRYPYDNYEYIDSIVLDPGSHKSVYDAIIKLKDVHKFGSSDVNLFAVMLRREGHWKKTDKSYYDNKIIPAMEIIFSRVDKELNSESESWNSLCCISQLIIKSKGIDKNKAFHWLTILMRNGYFNIYMSIHEISLTDYDPVIPDMRHMARYELCKLIVNYKNTLVNDSDSDSDSDSDTDTDTDSDYEAITVYDNFVKKCGIGISHLIDKYDDWFHDVIRDVSEYEFSLLRYTYTEHNIEPRRDIVAYYVNNPYNIDIDVIIRYYNVHMDHFIDVIPLSSIMRYTDNMAELIKNICRSGIIDHDLLMDNIHTLYDPYGKKDIMDIIREVHKDKIVSDETLMKLYMKGKVNKVMKGKCPSKYKKRRYKRYYSSDSESESEDIDNDDIVPKKIPSLSDDLNELCDMGYVLKVSDWVKFINDTNMNNGPSFVKEISNIMIDHKVTPNDDVISAMLKYFMKCLTVDVFNITTMVTTIQMIEDQYRKINMDDIRKASVYAMITKNTIKFMDELGMTINDDILLYILESCSPSHIDFTIFKGNKYKLYDMLSRTSKKETIEKFMKKHNLSYDAVSLALAVSTDKFDRGKLILDILTHDVKVLPIALLNCVYTNEVRGKLYEKYKEQNKTPAPRP